MPRHEPAEQQDVEEALVVRADQMRPLRRQMLPAARAQANGQPRDRIHNLDGREHRCREHALRLVELRDERGRIRLRLQQLRPRRRRLPRGVVDGPARQRRHLSLSRSRILQRLQHAVPPSQIMGS